MKMLKLMNNFQQDLMTNEHVGSQLYTWMIFICLGSSSTKKNIPITLGEGWGDIFLEYLAWNF